MMIPMMTGVFAFVFVRHFDWVSATFRFLLWFRFCEVSAFSFVFVCLLFARLLYLWYMCVCVCYMGAGFVFVAHCDRSDMVRGL